MYPRQLKPVSIFQAVIAVGGSKGSRQSSIDSTDSLRAIFFSIFSGTPGKQTCCPRLISQLEVLGLASMGPGVLQAPRRLEVFDQAFTVALWQSVGWFSQAQITREKQNEERFNLNLEFVVAFMHSNT